MTRKGYIHATHELEHPDTGGIISSTELRIHYRWQAEPNERPDVELDYVEAERSVGVWERVPEDDALWLWAEVYLGRNHDDVTDDVMARESLSY